MHIVHLSSASAVPILRDAKAEGLPITVETCPHYLCLTAEEIPKGATEFKCAPPIRDAANRDALWDALLEGVIDFVISDHSPCTPGLKLPEVGDFGGAWGGIASLSLGLTSVWTEGESRGVDVPRLAQWMSSAPARFAGVADRKGAIVKGHHADLLAFDPDAQGEVRPEALRFKHKISPYLGRPTRGAVRATWLRGEQIFDGGEVQTSHGRPLLHRGDGGAKGSA